VKHLTDFFCLLIYLLIKYIMTLTEARRIGYLFEESNGVLTEGILDRVKDSIKKKFSKEETEDIK
jgi:hypothetical protein